ncbi:hypothetical protein ACFU6R_33650 [Streptomyces sp. NPDC057499]|uniref:hypothetical protein n=1 Tax=Streptomyces sp. NPDC057499 TaxID=3346150 RepID=UPI0036D03CE2
MVTIFNSLSEQGCSELQRILDGIVESGITGITPRVRDGRGEWTGSAGAGRPGEDAKPPVDGHVRARVEHVLDDAGFAALSRRAAESSGWAPGDPRIDEVAGAPAGHYLANPEQLEIVTGLRARTEAATRYEMVARHGGAEAPGPARPAALVEARLRAAGVRVPGARSFH